MARVCFTIVCGRSELVVRVYFTIVCDRSELVARVCFTIERSHTIVKHTLTTSSVCDRS